MSRCRVRLVYRRAYCSAASCTAAVSVSRPCIGTDLKWFSACRQKNACTVLFAAGGPRARCRGCQPATIPYIFSQPPARPTCQRQNRHPSPHESGSAGKRNGQPSSRAVRSPHHNPRPCSSDGKRVNVAKGEKSLNRLTATAISNWRMFSVKLKYSLHPPYRTSFPFSRPRPPHLGAARTKLAQRAHGQHEKGRQARAPKAVAKAQRKAARKGAKERGRRLRARESLHGGFHFSQFASDRFLHPSHTVGE